MKSVFLLVLEETMKESRKKFAECFDEKLCSLHIFTDKVQLTVKTFKSKGKKIR